MYKCLFVNTMPRRFPSCIRIWSLTFFATAERVCSASTTSTIPSTVSQSAKLSAVTLASDESIRMRENCFRTIFLHVGRIEEGPSCKSRLTWLANYFSIAWPVSDKPEIPWLTVVHPSPLSSPPSLLWHWTRHYDDSSSSNTSFPKNWTLLQPVYRTVRILGSTITLMKTFGLVCCSGGRWKRYTRKLG